MLRSLLVPTIATIGIEGQMLLRFNKASAAIGNISAMMSDMQRAFGQLKSAYSALPDDVKWKLGCEVVSSIGTTGLIAYFSAGAGSPLLVRTLAQALTKVGAGYDLLSTRDLHSGAMHVYWQLVELTTRPPR